MLKKELLRHYNIMLVSTEAALKNFGFSFVENANTMIYRYPIDK